MVKIVKTTLRVLGKGVLFLLLAVLLYVLTALGFYGIAQIGPETTGNADKTIPIYLFADDFHADLMVPVDPMQPEWDYLLDTKALPVPRAKIKLLSFGWGSSAFYLKMREWSRLTLGLSLKALALDDTVMHVTAYRSDAVKLNHPMVSVQFIDRKGYKMLLDFIRNSYKLDQNQRAIPIPDKGYWSNDIFFMANGHYQPLRTCNQWTGEALRQAGVKVPLWTPFTQSLKWSMETDS